MDKLFFSLLLTLSLSPFTLADPHPSHWHPDLQRQIASGKVVPFAQVLDWLQQHYPGSTLETQFHRDNLEQMVYHVEWLTDQGQVLHFIFDASTGCPVTVQGASRWEWHC